MSREFILRGNVFQVCARYIAPSIIGMAGLSVYVLADTWFIANGIGSDGLSALNIVLPIFGLMGGIGLLCGVGGSTVFAIARGRSDERCNRPFMTALLLSGGAAAVFTVAGLFFPYRIAEWFGATPEIISYAGSYLQTVLLMSSCFLLNAVLLCFVRNDGAPRLAMTAMVTSTLANVFLDYLMIYPLQWGMFGAALATGLSSLIGILVLSLHFVRGRSNFGWECVMPGWSDIKRLIPPGLPGVVTEISSGVVIFSFNMMLQRYAGNTGVAAYGIIANISLVAGAVFTGIGQGIQPVVSTSFGAGEYARIRHVCIVAGITAFAVGVFCCTGGIVFAGAIAAAFNSRGVEELTRLTVNGIYWYFPAFLFMGGNFAGTAALAAMEHSREAFFISLLRGALLLIPVLLILGFWFGLNGVWLSVPVTELLTMPLTIFLMRSAWKRFRGRDSDSRLL